MLFHSKQDPKAFFRVAYVFTYSSYGQYEGDRAGKLATPTNAFRYHEGILESPGASVDGACLPLTADGHLVGPRRLVMTGAEKTERRLVFFNRQSLVTHRLLLFSSNSDEVCGYDHPRRLSAQLCRLRVVFR